ncbi:hypothetical protein RHSIM_Rhsim05G0107800 [Rhododendron simsii]|uniref:Uncharacterized protein n=1 Tax=Rhododendron simsii TaxID=118357 RepID=A0A834GZF6_RHOSS|nr:hypothetical protein RHSIM_Rhsim05G0107800 [Rhododendron simsii]
MNSIAATETEKSSVISHVPTTAVDSLLPLAKYQSSSVVINEANRNLPPVPSLPSSLSPINHLLSSMKFNGEVGVVAIDFAGANLQEVVFEVLSEIDGPFGFQVTKGLHHVESPTGVANRSVLASKKKMDQALITEIQNFKDIHHTVLDHLINNPYFAHQFPLLGEYCQNFGVWPPMDVLIPEEDEHVEEEREKEDPEEEEPDEEDSKEWENEEEPKVQANAWLNDHGMAELVQEEIEAIPEEEPEPKSDVEDPERPPVTMNLPLYGYTIPYPTIALRFYQSLLAPAHSTPLPPARDPETRLYDIPVIEETPPAPPCMHIDMGYLFDTPLTDLP